MAVDASLAGRTFPPTEAYDVTEQAVRDFAAATGTPYAGGDPAPATFPIVVAFGAMQGLMVDPEVGIELHHVVHGQQKFVHRASDRRRRPADRDAHRERAPPDRRHRHHRHLQRDHR